MMTHLELARFQMAFSLGFHIIFASISMVMPLFMTVAYYRFLKTKKPIYLKLTKAWSYGTAILFATGAVSGTALSFQLGLLWPKFMLHAGPIIGMPYSLEGAAFFLEAIFLGLFLYGLDKLSPKFHFFCAMAVGFFGLSSGFLVIAANGWMNAPSGFDWINGEAHNINPLKALFNEAWLLEGIHMLVAAIQATSIAALGLHAYGILKQKNNEFHLVAFKIILPFFICASLVQPLIGDLSAKSVAKRQPEKFAAMEAHFHTQKGASLHIGGIPNSETGEVSYGISIPKALSFLAHGDFNAEVKGLFDFPEEDRPPVLIPHIAFQIMVGIGSLLLGLSILFLFLLWKKPHQMQNPMLLKSLLFLIPTGFIALEAGWVVTEVGRQPWIIYKILRTSESVTPVPGIGYSLIMIVLLYSILGLFSFFLLSRIFRKSSE